MASHIDTDQTRIVEIVETKREASGIKTILFRDRRCSKAKPGQFVMVWILGVDEIPLSLSLTDHKGHSGITVAKVGEATDILCSKAPGEQVGVRGPYGNGFETVGGEALVVGGGIGLAPLMPLTEALSRRGVKATIIAGAKTKAALPFIKTINSYAVASHEVHVATDDGSYGVHGTVIDVLKDLLGKRSFDVIYTCGPEDMMLKVFNIAENHKTRIQACLERYMKCGLGLCGHCVLDPLGLRVCKDGPVFASEILRKSSDFGKYKTAADGRKIPV